MSPPCPNAIRSHRLRRGLHQRELAGLVGCKQTDISAYERERVPTLRRALALAACLGARVEDLFHGLVEGVAHEVGGRLAGVEQIDEPNV